MNFKGFLLLSLILLNFSFLSKAQQHHNCGTDHMQEELGRLNPQYLQELQDFQQLIQFYSTQQNSSRNIITIPVVIQVIHLSTEAVGTGRNLSEARIQAQLQILNNDFNALNSNYTSGTPSVFQSARANPQIQFCLATRDPNGNPTNGIVRSVYADPTSTSTIENTIKPAIRWNTQRYLNIYTVAIPGTSSFGGTLGYAYLPTIGMPGSSQDGIVIDYRWFGAPGFSGFSGAGRALTHEAGHYLGLPHIWGETTSNHVCTDDDGIGDTPIQSGPTADVSFNCSNYTTLPTSCSGIQRMFCNYMDYLNSDACYSMYTQGQVNVMRNVLQGVSQTVNGNSYSGRTQLVTNGQTACTASTAPDAGITAHVTPANNSVQCGNGNITPVVTLRNFSSTALTAVTIRYQVNGGTAVNFNWTGNLASNATTNVTLAAFTPPSGAFTFRSFTSNPNGVVDGIRTNDTLTTNHTASAIISLPYSENFSGTAFNPTASNLRVTQQPSDAWTWTRNTVSAFGTGTGSARMDNYASSATQTTNPNGTLDNLITPTFTFNGVTNATLTFDVAYARYVNSAGTSFSNDTLIVLYSTDCGVTYNNVLFRDGGASLATAPAANGAFTPTSTQWASKSINLSALNNAPSVTFAIRSRSGWGNNLFIDNINITGNTPTCNLSASTSGTNTTCGQSNGSATVTPSGGTTYTYLWSNGGSSATISNLAAGTYTVTVTSGACTATATRVVNSSTGITASTSGSNTTCGLNNGSATVTPSGGASYTYSWSNGGSSATISNLAGGTYNVTVTSGACTATASRVINSSTAVTASTSGTNATCGLNNGSATVTPSGGSNYTYSWSNGGNTATISNLSAGTYNVTVTSGTCNTTATRVVTNSNTGITASASGTNTTCGLNNGSATVTPSGGSNYTYSWSNGSNSATISNLAAGTYNVTVTSGTCTTTATRSVASSSNTLSVNLSSTPSTTSNGNGSASASVSGGSPNYSYAWSNGGNTSTISNLQAGNYTVTVTDQQGCTSSQQVNISSTISIEETSIFSKLEISPIPASDYIIINASLKNATSLDIALYGIDGKLLVQNKAESSDNHFITLNITDFTTGVYILCISTPTETLKTRVLKQ